MKNSGAVLDKCVEGDDQKVNIIMKNTAEMHLLTKTAASISLMSDLVATGPMLEIAMSSKVHISAMFVIFDPNETSRKRAYCLG